MAAGGARDGSLWWETFSVGTDAQNLARADGFKRMVEAAGQRWPEGWVKGEGFVRPPDVVDPLTRPPTFDEIGEEYVRQIVDLSPGQRKRYLGQLKVLAATPVRGALVFAGPVDAIGEAQLKMWLIEWDRSLKTKANYHGLIYGVFAYAVKRGWLATNPATGTAPKQSRVKQSRPELRFLTERELETAVRLAKGHGDVLAVAVGTGLRFGELSALWVGDVDLDRGTIRVNKAWKRNGEARHLTPAWLARQLRPNIGCVTTISAIRRHLGRGGRSPSRPPWLSSCGTGSMAGRLTTSSLPAGAADRCTTATSTPMCGGS